MSQRVLVTKSAKDVSSSSLNDFYFHSSYPLLKVHSTGTFNIVQGATGTVTHSLGYRPFVMSFSQKTEGSASLRYYQHDWRTGAEGPQNWGETTVFTDRLEFSVGDTLDGGTYTLSGFYYIFEEQVT